MAIYRLLAQYGADPFENNKDGNVIDRSCSSSFHAAAYTPYTARLNNMAVLRLFWKIGTSVSRGQMMATETLRSMHFFVLASISLQAIMMLVEESKPLSRKPSPTLLIMAKKKLLAVVVLPFFFIPLGCNVRCEPGCCLLPTTSISRCFGSYTCYCILNELVRKKDSHTWEYSRLVLYAVYYTMLCLASLR